MGRFTRLSAPRVAGVVALAALLAAMVLNTRFVTPDQLASFGPEEFDPSEAAEQLYGEAGKVLPERAVPLPELLDDLHADVAKAAEKHDAARPNDTTYVFTVVGEAKITGGEEPPLELKVDGVAAQTPVSLAQGPTINGTVMRDALGFEFGDAPNQTAYQGVGNELGSMMQQRLAKAMPESETGATVRFTGLLSVTDTGMPMSPRKPISIQPVSVEVVQ